MNEARGIATFLTNSIKEGNHYFPVLCDYRNVSTVLRFYVAHGSLT